MQHFPRQRLQLFTLALCFICVASLTWACSVPVFRYALERWPSDRYEVIVFYKGKLDETQKKLVVDLTEEGAAGKQHANVQVNLVDLDTLNSKTLKSETSEDADLIKLWEEQKTKTLPWMTVKFPKVAQNNLSPVWSGELTADNIKQLLDSPVRHEVARQILKGETAVWIVLEIGDKAKDDAAAKVLQTELSRAEKELELAKISDEDVASGLVSVDQKKLKLKFSVVRLSRTNVAEKMLVEMLLGSEDDLRELKEPMAFPVFGRGRVLYGLIGKGINKDTVRVACQELIGPCTCEVKDENPGVDLLTSVDWETLVEPTVEIDRELPPLPGFGGIVEGDHSKQKESEPANSKPRVVADKKNIPTSSMLPTVSIITGVGMLILLGSYFLIRKEN